MFWVVILAAASSASAFEVACTASPLGVKYDIAYYDGTVSCGNVLLEADIGGGINVPPTVTYAEAKPERFYTVLYVDPDAMSGYWPDQTQPGSHAPVRHWVQGNILGSALLSGNLSMSTEVQHYKGPSPPSGSHRYAQWLFEQPEGRIEFEEMPASIIQWDYEAFAKKHGFGEPVASNWHVTQFADHRDASGSADNVNATAPVSGAVSLNCSAPHLTIEYDISYYSGKVNCGTLLLESDIGGGIDVPPRVAFEHAGEGEYYTLIYFDPDADMAGSWPNVTTPGSHAPVRHWVAGNIPGGDLRAGDLSGATTVSAFKGPSPPLGSHRYGQWLFSQHSQKIDYVALDDNARVNWDYEDFIAKHGLGEAVAMNWHVVQYMAPRGTSGVVVV
eukprot:NODE_10880_length_1323_cov_4.286789.p1 GENE.NODE_10880_length_1323_cov_4.286789~~NODE_10880_length_1323_cov_4.286789.p1  ORF type:complete len:388 (-),score=108.02 NODE_10880_length_1323_cov_4.286789:89-1252(-)